MNSGVYAVVKRYEQNGDKFAEWFYKPSEHYDIYERLMEVTGYDHEISCGGASWCELATIGEIYEFREGEIEIQEID